MGDRLVHIHINDNNAGNDCLLPGAGDVDYQRLFEILKKNSYSGDFMLEVYRCNYDDMAQLVNSYEYVKKIVSEFSVKQIKISTNIKFSGSMFSILLLFNNNM